MLEKEAQIGISIVMSTVAYRLTKKIIPRFRDSFIKAHLVGIDQAKQVKKPIPEAMGVVAGCIFLITMFLFIPIPFLDAWKDNKLIYIFSTPNNSFEHHEFAAMLAALLSICCMLFLGFADDVLDLRWRHKLLLPTIAFIPLLMVYIVQYNVTTVILPKPVRPYFGDYIILGPLYYVYMGMLAIFCTNAINILAGINGLEVGQSVVISASILIFNSIELWGDCWKAHLFSATFMFPFFAVSCALLSHNWYPANVFVGDTYCYFAGMTFAVVGILGHFSKTMMLFFIPQVFNFIFSCPQLFHLIPCPRHRLPKYCAEKDILNTSTFEYSPSETNIVGRLVVYVYNKLGLVEVR
ncbi:UDP-N-acetylglucosamine--dolichyl-phosphate N-acetylglucosaminephosphotransferase [Halotydeus destructor]|nr:UDP-N-acetylglucosamine--dolichyl-phosphate N-acetylglucosaminephosphotransferase [Halotydeus destructor]